MIGMSSCLTLQLSSHFDFHIFFQLFQSMSVDETISNNIQKIVLELVLTYVPNSILSFGFPIHFLIDRRWISVQEFVVVPSTELLWWLPFPQSNQNINCLSNRKSLVNLYVEQIGELFTSNLATFFCKVDTLRWAWMRRRNSSSLVSSLLWSPTLASGTMERISSKNWFHPFSTKSLNWSKKDCILIC